MLTGCRILLTAQRRSDELAAALVRRGATVDRVPTLGVVPHIDEQTLLQRTAGLLADPPDIVVVTTGIGFRGWVEATEAAGLGEALLRVLAEVRLIARGPKAQGALQAAGLAADWVADTETSAEIAAFLLDEGVDGAHIAVQHHGAGDTSLDEALVRGGAEVVPLEVYRWGPPPDPDAVVRSAYSLAAGEYDAVLFTSAPGVVAWLDVLTAEGLDDVVRGLVTRGRLQLFVVGPVTEEPLAFAGFLALRPVRSRMGALVRLVITELGDEHRGLATVHGQLRLRARSATLDHRPVALSPGGLAVLRRLADAPGQVVTREDLLTVLPGESTDPHAAEVAVARLREGLREAGADGRLVKTVVKRGYVLAAT